MMKKCEKCPTVVDVSEDYYKVGDTFKILHDGLYEYYIIAQVRPSEAALIGLDDGNRYSEPIKVGYIGRINSFEFKKICGNLYPPKSVKKVNINFCVEE